MMGRVRKGLQLEHGRSVLVNGRGLLELDLDVGIPLGKVFSTHKENGLDGL